MSAEGDVDRRTWQRSIGSQFTAGLIGVILGFVAFAWLNEAWAPDAQARVVVLLAAAGLFGVLATITYVWMGGRETENSWLYVALFCVAILAIAAARTDQLSLVQALLILVFGNIALVAAVHALSLFRLGEAIQFESSLVGLGGGLGGWRLSPATSLIVSAFLFACGAIVVAQVSRPDPPQSVITETKAAKDAASAAKQPAAKPTPGATAQPTPGLTAQPSPGPTAQPTPGLTAQPTPGPTAQPTPGPTATPSATPSGPKAPGSTP